MSHNPQKSFEGTSRSILSRLGSIGSKSLRIEEEKPQLDEIIDINKDLDLFRDNHIKLLRAETLYENKKFTFKIGLFRSYKEEMISCLDQDYKSIELLNAESKRKLLDKTYKLIHNGLIVIGIKRRVLAGFMFGSLS